ncbi:MAG: ATPase domain-containing protein, partial [Firmicutes bacterium]|nr:ATPase domain-containing protein [Bacillota bacterium]
MAKAKSIYVCLNCGAQTYKWQGKCTNCNEWNTLELQEEAVNDHSKGFNLAKASPPVLITEVSSQQEERYETGIVELDRVLGGGVVPGSLTLLAGEPGVGKSTLLLQLAKEFSEKWGKVLYISG